MKRSKKTTLAKKPGNSRMPSYQLSLPVLLVLFLFFMVFGGGLTYLTTRSINGESPEAAGPTSMVMITDTLPADTPAPTDTPVPTITNTPEPVPTLEPVPYTVQSGDTCQAIAGTFNISTTALITANGLSVNCYLVIGQVVQVPQPTPLPTSEAIATQAARQTEAACPIEFVTVQTGDTIEIISQYTLVPVEEILAFNGKASSLLFAGEVLSIPTCKQTTDANGATFTPSPAPTYNAPKLIQPPKGRYFSADDEIILQWVAPAELRGNEFFLLTISDSTEGGTVVLEQTLKETRFIIPTAYQPQGDNAHIYSWQVSIIAQIGEDAEGNALFRTAASVSEILYFAWESE